jgi:hypothetical protein
MAIEHVGKPGQGMPEFSPGGGKSPFDTLQREPGLDIEVLRHINRIIDDDKLMTEYIPIDQNRNEGQRQADKKVESVKAVHIRRCMIPG